MQQGDLDGIECREWRLACVGRRDLFVADQDY
jgi:hypothetical protein